jgi:dTDP-D-glucose 4,6-dehydratase
VLFRSIKPFNGEIFNIGQENLKIIEIAEKIKKIIKKRFEKDVDILIEPSSDPRSYQINSEKSINMLNFSYKKNVEFAINEIINAFEQNKILDSFSENWQNISVLKKLENKSNFFKK